MAPHTSLKNQLRTIRRSTRLIARSLERLASQLRRADRQAEREATPKRTLRITPKRRAQLKLQGAYMGWMRQLKPPQKARVRAVKAGKGIEVAIGVARKIATPRWSGSPRCDPPPKYAPLYVDDALAIRKTDPCLQVVDTLRITP